MRFEPIRDFAVRCLDAAVRWGVLLFWALPLVGALLHLNLSTRLELAGALFGGCVAVGLRPSPRCARRLVFGGALALVLLEGVHLLHQAAPYSDFATQWQTAIRFAEEGIGEIRRPQTQRALPLYFPLVVLFGPHRGAYVAAGALLSVANGLLSLRLAFLGFGWTGAARAAVVLPLFWEPFAASTIPSHDIPGTFGLLAALVLLAELRRRQPPLSARFFALSAVGGLGAWVHWQRDTGIFVVAACAAYAVSELLFERRPRSAALLLTPVLVMGLALGGLRQASLLADIPIRDMTSGPMNQLAFSGADGPAAYRDKAAKYPYMKALPEASIRELSRTLGLETLRTAPVRKARSFLARSRALLWFGADEGWYFHRSERPEIAAILRPIYRAVSRLSAPALWVMGLLAALGLVLGRGPALAPRWVPLLVATAFVLAMGTLGEIQTRYAHFLPFLVASSGGLTRPEPELHLGKVTAALAALVAIPLLLAVAISVSPIRLAHIAPAAGVRVTQNLALWTGSAKYALDPTSLDLSLPSASRERFRFVLAEESLTQTATLAHGRRLSLEIDGVKAWTRTLSSTLAPQLVELPVSDAGHRLRFTLEPGSGPARRTTVVAFPGAY